MIPLFIGADEMAWPRMNALGAWGISAALVLMYIPFITNLLGLTGLPDNAGWFAYPPLRSMLNTSGTDFAIMSIWVLGVASLTGGGINFFVTIINERKPGTGLVRPTNLDLDGDVHQPPRHLFDSVAPRCMVDGVARTQPRDGVLQRSDGR